MTTAAQEAANQAAALRDLAPHGVDLHFSLVATRKPVEVKWHASPYRKFVGTVKYGGLDMEKAPLFWGRDRFQRAAREFIEHAGTLQASLAARLTAECVSPSWGSLGAQMVARRRFLRSSLAHRLR